MLRKFAVVFVALALPLVAASAASAQQYPPTGDAPAPTTAVEETSLDRGGAPLADTGTDIAPLGGVALVLVAGGTVALVAARRRHALRDLTLFTRGPKTRPRR